MKFFILNGFCTSPSNSLEDISCSGTRTREKMAQLYKKADITPPVFGEKVFFRDADYGRISVFVYGEYEAFIMIVARSQCRAYLLGSAFRAVMACFQGRPPGNHLEYFLLELTKKPDLDMTRKDISALVNLPGQIGSGPNIEIKTALGSGTGLFHEQIDHACEIIRRVLSQPRLLDALLHLEYSRTLVDGYMVGSYYESHYSLERRELSRYELKAMYLEDRFRYDSAFVSAFRGIECLLERTSFKKHEIHELLRSIDAQYGTSFSSTKHRSFHEVFSSNRKWWRYEGLISHYLKLRNAVSAHGNPSPPHVVMEDQVFEIQYLLEKMLRDILDFE